MPSARSTLVGGVAVIEVEGLKRTYGAIEALAGISFSVDRGTIVGLLGPNGAGKTTTLSILTAQRAPTAGTAKVCGHDVVLEPLAVRRMVGAAPEGAPAYEDMQVRGYLTFLAQVFGLGPAETARAVARVAETCDLADRLAQSIGTLSKGYRQRLALAGALVHDPPLLLLDEPTAGLDPQQVAQMRGLLRELGRTRTVVLSTHILSEAEAVCDRILILHRGRLVADAPTASLTAARGGRWVTLALGHGKVTVDGAAVQAALMGLPGVRDVRGKAPGADLARFEVESEGDVRAELFRWAVSHGHVLVELSTVAHPLEDAFRALTTEGP